MSKKLHMVETFQLSAIPGKYTEISQIITQTSSHLTPKIFLVQYIVNIQFIHSRIPLLIQHIFTDCLLYDRHSFKVQCTTAISVKQKSIPLWSLDSSEGDK